LYGKKNSISFPIKDVINELAYLISIGLITVKGGVVIGDEPEKYLITDKGLRLCTKYDQYFSISKKRTSKQLMGEGYGDMIKLYRSGFPAGKLPSGKPGRQNIRTLENAFRWFFEVYDYTWKEVTDATIMYINQYEEKDYMYMKTSQYFICKQDKNKVKHSELADYCDMIRDGVMLDTNNHFKENVI
jgi:hypothetical protein